MKPTASGHRCQIAGQGASPRVLAANEGAPQDSTVGPESEPVHIDRVCLPIIHNPMLEHCGFPRGVQADVIRCAGVAFVLLEASDRVGGRVRTDVVDGFTLDHGFQIFLTSYPEAQVRRR